MPQPTRYSAALGQEVCRRLAEGGTLTALCREEAMPARHRVGAWLSEQPAFAAAFRAARREQLETWAEEMLLLADGLQEEDSREALARAKLRIDVRQWLIARLAPRPEEPLAAEQARPVMLQVVTGIERPGDSRAAGTATAGPQGTTDEASFMPTASKGDCHVPLQGAEAATAAGAEAGR